MIVDELIAVIGFDFKGEDDLRRFNSGLDQAAAGLGRFASIAGAAAAAAGAALAAGMAFLGKSVISTSAQFETYAATLETIEGSAEKAEKSLDWIAEFAQKTPYDVAQTTEAFVKLRAYGLDPTNGLLEDLGNSASAMGKSLNDAVEMIADAGTNSFERMKEFGVTASQAGDKVTFSWDKNGKTLTKTVKKNGEEIRKFIQANLSDRFGGAMLRQSKTWNGMISNLGDSWTNFLRKIGQSGFFDAAKNKLADLMDSVGRWSTDGRMEKVAKALSNGFVTAADGIGFAISRIVRHVGWLTDNMDKAKPYLTALGVAMGALFAWTFPVVTAFAFAGLAVEDFLTWLEGGDSVIGKFAEALADLSGLDEGTIAGILAAVATGGIALAAAVGPIRLMTAAITGLARALGLMGSAKVAQGVAAVGSAGTAATAATAAKAGPSLFGKFFGSLGLGLAAYEGAQSISNPGEGLKNAPRSAWGVDDALRWIYRKATQDSSGPDYASDAALANRDAANTNVFQGFEDMIKNGRANSSKMAADGATQSVTNTLNDTSDRSVTVQVGGVTVQGVQNVTPAVGAAVGQAVGNASANAATPPARLVGGGL